MKKIAFIIHGKIKHREKLVFDIKQMLQSTGELYFFVTEQANQCAVLSAQALKLGVTHLICVGGDGTLNEVMNGVMQARDRSGLTQDIFDQLRIGLLPRGTGNDFARTMGVSFNLDELKRNIDGDHFRTIDIGLALFKSSDGDSCSRYFINITDVGIGGVIAQKLTTASKFWGSTITYQKALLTTMLSYKTQALKLTTDTQNYEGKVMSLIIANGKYFGGGMGIAPDALPDDGLFSIVVAGEISMLQYLLNLGEVRKCRKVRHPALHYFSAREINIEPTGDHIPIDMDGEFIGYAPLKISVVSGALKFLCP